ncbi:MAG: Gfo/Idh/MocA family oxidoreductase [Betaproteobacteria bacterium]|nr:Gfo/Idh/MocA family oxidoreductase [Betaproteobacteria bacterium]
MQHKKLGVAVIGCGRMGRLRASLAAVHPAVSFLAVSDADSSRARLLAENVGAQFHSDDNLKAISRPEVDAVIVSTSENEHALPVLQAIELRKPVLVEKPIALSLEDADRMLSAAARMGVELRVGYSRRFKRGYLLAKEQIAAGRFGRIVGAAARAYNSRAQAFQILQRSPNATAITYGMTYYVDLICWFLEGNPAVEVVARGQKGVFQAAGYIADDVNWAILTFADGAIASLGVDYALPAKYPSFGANARLEILGTEGVMLLDDDHKDQVFYTDRGIEHSYVPGHYLNAAFMSSTASGDWAQGDYWGPLGDETRTWLDHLATGRACVVATAEQGRKVLEITLAIEQAVRTRKAVSLPLTEAG